VTLPHTKYVPDEWAHLDDSMRSIQTDGSRYECPNVGCKAVLEWNTAAAGLHLISDGTAAMLLLSKR
jgi:hypothetical protein